MSNNLSDKYFIYQNLIKKKKEIINKIKTETGFVAKKEIFRGELYDKDKVGSLIYKGKFQEKPAVLKIQLLRPEIDEIDIINTFNRQNKSKKIRLPYLFKGSRWNKKDGYGYLLMEFVEGKMIYNPPFASETEIKDFCSFYQEYKTKCLNKPLFAKSIIEQSSLVFTTQRIFNWLKIAEAKNNLTEIEIKYTEKFLHLAGEHLPQIEMQFMHGHLTYADIFKTSGEEYVLMSNLFWSYRPEYYDATFNLWAGIKSIRDLKITERQIIKYINSWISEYKKLPAIKRDADFEKKFNLLMAERCLGALLVDIQNQNYAKNKKVLTAHLIKIFKNLFDHFTEKL